jgi:hypothetical protein
MSMLPTSTEFKIAKGLVRLDTRVHVPPRTSVPTAHEKNARGALRSVGGWVWVIGDGV